MNSNTAWIEGFQTRQYGYDISVNPYDEGTHESESWITGYKAASDLEGQEQYVLPLEYDSRWEEIDRE